MEYRQAHRDYQDQFDSRRLADRLASVAGDEVSPFREFIEARDMFFLATADAAGQPQCIGNLSENPLVGLLFVDFARGSRLRMTGHASVDPEDPLLEELPGTRLVVRVRATAVFPNCRRYVHTHGPNERSPFVPVPGQRPPVPDWKRDEWFDGTLPANDPALDASNPSAPATPAF